MSHPITSLVPARRRALAWRQYCGVTLLAASAWAGCAGAVAATDAERLGELERLLAGSHTLIQQLSQRIQHLLHRVNLDRHRLGIQSQLGRQMGRRLE